jgi:prephenate dehydrogenase
MIKRIPWLRNMATAKSLIVHEMIDLETVKEDILETIERFSAKKETDSWGTHPIFGKLDKWEWGQLQYKHTVHHLNQFGVLIS